MTGDSDVILPYRFKPNGLWSSSEESEENDSDNGKSQSSFTEQLGNTLWCFCVNCVVMPHAFECTCCREFPEVEEHLEEGVLCFTSLEAFKTVCFRQRCAIYCVGNHAHG